MYVYVCVCILICWDALCHSRSLEAFHTQLAFCYEGVNVSLSQVMLLRCFLFAMLQDKGNPPHGRTPTVIANRYRIRVTRLVGGRQLLGSGEFMVAERAPLLYGPGGTSPAAFPVGQSPQAGRHTGVRRG